RPEVSVGRVAALQSSQRTVGIHPPDQSYLFASVVLVVESCLHLALRSLGAFSAMMRAFPDVDARIMAYSEQSVIAGMPPAATRVGKPRIRTNSVVDDVMHDAMARATDHVRQPPGPLLPMIVTAAPGAHNR